MLSLADRTIRAVGVGCYLVALGFAIFGLYGLRASQPEIAKTFLVCMVVFTLLHLPRVMNTRLRVPLMEPVILVLAGIGWARWSSGR